MDYPQRPGQQAAGVKNNGTDKGKGKKNGHHKNDQNLLPTSATYVYDSAGNRVSKSDDYQTVNYQYNVANQLLQAGDTVYNYDANGNRISKQDASGISDYRYNHDNFLIQFISPDGEATDYGYDAMNRRVYKATEGEVITSYLYDGLEVLQEVSGHNSQKITAYYRAKGRIITQQKYNVTQGHHPRYQHRPEGQQLYYAYDGLGSVTALSNHWGKQQTRYHYDAFGEVIDGDLSENQYGFSGRQLDPESGLYHFHFRQYDAEAGVWTTPDPIGILGGLNLYGYVQNNPVNFWDWLGMCSPNMHQSHLGSLSLNSTFWGIGGEYPMLGSRDTIIPPGSVIGLTLEVGLFGHNFAKYHDWLMDQLGYTSNKPFGFFGWTINLSSMPLAYAGMALATTLQGIFDFAQDPLGTIGEIGSQFAEAISTIGGYIGVGIDAISGFFGSSQSSGNNGRGESGSGSGIGGFSGADLGKGSESW